LPRRFTFSLSLLRFRDDERRFLNAPTLLLLSLLGLSPRHDESSARSSSSVDTDNFLPLGVVKLVDEEPNDANDILVPLSDKPDDDFFSRGESNSREPFLLRPPCFPFSRSFLLALRGVSNSSAGVGGDFSGTISQLISLFMLSLSVKDGSGFSGLIVIFDKRWRLQLGVALCVLDDE